MIQVLSSCGLHCEKHCRRHVYIGKVHLFSRCIDVQFFRLHSSVVGEMYFIKITSLSCVQLSDVISMSGLYLRTLTRLAFVWIMTE